LVPPGVEAVIVRLEEQVRTIGRGLASEIGVEAAGRTVTVKVPLVLSPHESLAVMTTGVVPSENVLPLGGNAVTERGELQPPPAWSANSTAATPATDALTVMFEG